MIFSSDQEFTLWPEPGTELTIDLDSTSVALPIVGGKQAWKKSLREEKKDKAKEKSKENGKQN